MSDDVMPRDEVRRMLFALVAAVLGDKPPPAIESNYRYIHRDDVDVVSDELTRIMAEHLNKIPETFSSNLEIQESLQQKIDEAVSGIVLLFKTQFGILEDK